MRRGTIPLFQLLRIRRSWLQIVSAYCPIPPTPLYTRGAWPVRTSIPGTFKPTNNNLSFHRQRGFCCEQKSGRWGTIRFLSIFNSANVRSQGGELADEVFIA